MPNAKTVKHEVSSQMRPASSRTAVQPTSKRCSPGSGQEEVSPIVGPMNRKRALPLLRQAEEITRATLDELLLELEGAGIRIADLSVSLARNPAGTIWSDVRVVSNVA